MFARIVVDLGARKDSLTVPERALVDLQGRTFLWVVGKDNTTSQRAVVAGERTNGMAVISEGLAAGERIIVEGLQKVREGAPVQILPAKRSLQ
jgi:membrane fusion protein (multidrug efflux system)